MKPTKPGYYWLLQYHTNCVTKAKEPGIPVVVHVGLDRKPRSRKIDDPKVLIVGGGYWREELDKMSDDCQWSEEIPCTLPSETSSV